MFVVYFHHMISHQSRRGTPIHGTLLGLGPTALLCYSVTLRPLSLCHESHIPYL